MYEKLDECPACGHTQFLNHMICEDLAATNESFALVKCTKCQLVFTNPRPTEDHIGKYYEHDNYVSHTNKANNLTNLIYKVVRQITLKQKRTLINKVSKGKRLLDFGCGAGTFLDFMNSSGFDCTGYEPSPNANLTLHHNLTIHSNLNDLEREDQYDVITAWHVIEHVHQLSLTLKTLKKLLKKNGKFIVAVPNINSSDAQHYQQHWAAYDVPRHLYHFSQDSMIQLMKKYNFCHESTHPMIFDAYYVSLLSEKYKKSTVPLLNAFKQGYHSNTQAQQSSEYSSLIYVFSR